MCPRSGNSGAFDLLSLCQATEGRGRSLTLLNSPRACSGKRVFGAEQATNADSFFRITQKKRDQIGIVGYCGLQDLHVFLPACHQVFLIVPPCQRPCDKIGDANSSYQACLGFAGSGSGSPIAVLIGRSSMSCLWQNAEKSTANK